MIYYNKRGDKTKGKFVRYFDYKRYDKNHQMRGPALFTQNLCELEGPIYCLRQITRRKRSTKVIWLEIKDDWKERYKELYPEFLFKMIGET